MREPSSARKRTLQLQDRAIAYSVAVNTACPEQFTHIPSRTVWEQLVRAADSTSNNLVEADDASGDADFVYKIRVALREAKESRTCLRKIRLGSLAHHDKIGGLEQEAWELSRILATIVINTENRLARQKAEREEREPPKRRRP